MRPIHVLALLVLGAVWGASFLFIGIAVKDLGPLPLMFVRVLIAGLILALAALALRQRAGAALDLRRRWPRYLLLGLLNSALPFTLIAWSELTLPVSLAAILNSTTPLFTALIAAAAGSERLTRRKLAGVLLGIVGVTVLVGGGPLALTPAVLLAVIASLAAALSYGLGTVYAAPITKGLPPVYASIVQLLGAAVILATPATLTWPALPASAPALLALAALIVFSTSFAYLLYFFLLRHVGPTRTASVTLLVPVFGTLWAWLFLREPLGGGMLIGMTIVLASVTLVTGAGLRRPAQPQIVGEVE